jgi:phytoene dehydrogenase-like protein
MFEIAVRQADPVQWRRRTRVTRSARNGSPSRLARSFSGPSPWAAGGIHPAATMSAADFLDQWFETDPLKATMSSSGSSARSGDPLSGAYVLLHHSWARSTASCAPGGCEGRTGAVSGRSRAPRSFGAEIGRTAVERFLTQATRSPAPSSAGDEVTGRVTLSSLDRSRRSSGSCRQAPPRPVVPRGGCALPYRGCGGKVNLALDGLPEFTCQPGGEYLRGASASAEHRHHAGEPRHAGSRALQPGAYIDMVIPTLVDPSMAPRAARHELLRPKLPAAWPRRADGTTPGVMRSGRQIVGTSRSGRRTSASCPARAGAHPQGHRG